MNPGRTTDGQLTASPSPPTARTNGHDLVAVMAWLPGAEPTDYDIDLSEGPGYRTRYWRCTACGSERARPRAFDTPCPTASRPEPVADGGQPVEDGRTRRALAEELSVSWISFGSSYAVDDDGTRFFVDIEARTCSCSESAERAAECDHLRRADLALHTGELPGPDGSYVG